MRVICSLSFPSSFWELRDCEALSFSMSVVEMASMTVSLFLDANSARMKLIQYDYKQIGNSMDTGRPICLFGRKHEHTGVEIYGATLARSSPALE